MAEIKIKGDISGSTTIKAPDSGSDEVIELSTVLDGKAPLDSPTFTGTPALPDGTTLAGSLLTSGKILQIVRATDSTDRSTTSTSISDTGLSVTITPEKSDSAIILLWTARLQTTNSTDDDLRAVVQITDNSNNALSGSESISVGTLNVSGSGSRSIRYPLSLVAYSTPGTTSATTYKTRWQTITSNVTLQLFNNSNTGQMYAIEVSA